MSVLPATSFRSMAVASVGGGAAVAVSIPSWSQEVPAVAIPVAAVTSAGASTVVTALATNFVTSPSSAAVAAAPDNSAVSTAAKSAESGAVEADTGAAGGKKPVSSVQGASKEAGLSTVNLPVVAAKWVGANPTSGAQLDVRLPRQVVGSAASSVLIELPSQVTSAIGGGAAAVKVTAANNGPAPAWVQYSAQRGGLVVGNVPAGSLPAQIRLTVGQQQFSVQLGAPAN